MAEHLVCGIHAVKALLEQASRETLRIYLGEQRCDARMEALIALAAAQGIPIERLSSAKMDARFSKLSHQGIVAETVAPRTWGEADLEHLLERAKKPALILILDGVTDPHNLGACLRSADAAGVDFVIVPRDRSAPLTPAVSKVACGAAETIPLVRATNLVRAMEILKAHGVWIYGAAGEAQDTLYSLTFNAATALVMGAEGSGLRRLTREHCDGLFSIPMQGTVESLNVSVATGICLFEATRQRMQTGR